MYLASQDILMSWIRIFALDIDCPERVLLFSVQGMKYVKNEANDPVLLLLY
jgi:hypothetical protein